jgi:hypothetical protein
MEVPSRDTLRKEGMDFRNEMMPKARGEAEAIYADDPDQIARRDARRADVEGQYAQLNDPKRQKMDQLVAFLTGGANRSGIGSIGAGAAANSSQMRAGQESARAAQLDKLLGMEDADIAREDARKGNIAGYIGKVLDDATAMSNTALQTHATLASVAQRSDDEAKYRDLQRELNAADNAAREAITRLQGGDSSGVPDLIKYADLLGEVIATGEMNAQALKGDALIAEIDRLERLKESHAAVMQTIGGRLGVSGGGWQTGELPE